MFYIKMESDRRLTITVRESIYRGENLNQKLCFLLPAAVGEVDTAASRVFLNYVRADGIADVVELKRLDDKYNESYLQYTFPVSCKLTKCVGEVCMWLNIFSGTPSAPTIVKSGECMVQVSDSKNMDDYLCDHHVSAIYALQEQTENTANVVKEIRELIGLAVEDNEAIYFSENSGTDNRKDGDSVIYFK